MNYYTREEIESKIKEIKDNGVNSLGDAIRLGFWEQKLLELCK